MTIRARPIAASDAAVDNKYKEKICPWISSK